MGTSEKQQVPGPDQDGDKDMGAGEGYAVGVAGGLNQNLCFGNRDLTANVFSFSRESSDTPLQLNTLCRLWLHSALWALELPWPW